MIELEKQKGGHQMKVLRWSLTQASVEFGVSREKLRRDLNEAGIQPGPDSAYSTQDICRAVFGDITAEKLRLTKEQADKAALLNAAFRREYILVDDALAIVRRLAYAVRQKIVVSTLTADEKNALLLDIQRLRDADFTKMPDDEEEVADAKDAGER